MKFWTIQSKGIIDNINNEGIFEPSIYKSRYKISMDLYNFMLKSFNSVNNTNLSGLVFAFAKYDNMGITEIKDFNDFKDFVRNKKDVLDCFWQMLNEDSIIIELDFDENYNLIYLDYNDFQFLMPPVYLIPPYDSKSEEYIKQNISKGIFPISKFPSNIIQAHLPYIKKDNIINTYKLFEL